MLHFSYFISKFIKISYYFTYLSQFWANKYVWGRKIGSETLGDNSKVDKLC